MPKTRRDLSRQRFDRLFVLGLWADCKVSNRRTWECYCDCGNYKNVMECNLTNGLTRSCGCLTIEYNLNRAHYTNVGTYNSKRISIHLTKSGQYAWSFEGLLR